MKNSSLLLVLVSLPLLFLAPPLHAAPDPALAGRIVYVDGEVTANGLEAETGDLLSGPVVLKTGKGAVLEVIFAGKNIFRLGAETVAKVDFSELKKTVSLEKGVFTSVLKKLGQAAGSAAFVLKTPTLNAGVRGTSFNVSTDGNRTYFCTCNGSVELDDPAGDHPVVLTNAHHGARIYTKAADGTVSVTEGGLEGHTDASIETLAGRIAVGVDWSVPDLNHE
jgi:ferric-dicitrate binding protein FerR (iron transport regulator)